MSDQYIIIPGTDRRIYDGTIVILNRLPNLKWILHNGPYTYNGRRQRGWYFSSIPSDTTMPVYNEDLVNLIVVDGSESGGCPGPYPPHPPIPPYPPCPPVPPAPIPIPFTVQDRKQIQSAMITVPSLHERDKLGSDFLPDGKIVRVNDIDGNGTIEYYSWCAATYSWKPASLGYRYMTREEIEQAIGSDIVEIAWSDDHGALVITDNNGNMSETELSGVAHDIGYASEELKIRIPMYGKDDLEITIPKDNRIIAIRFEQEWVFPDGSVKPAIVATVSDGETTTDIAGDASDLYNIYEGAETATATVQISSTTSKITADVKLSSVINNSIEIDNEGLLVDLSGYVNKQPIDTSWLLVADGNGGFTYAGTGIEVETSTAISDLTNPEKKVVTANLIADAIAAAIASVTIDIEERLQRIENRIDFGVGSDGDILMSDGDRIARSGKSAGGSELPETGSGDILVTEEAVVNALSWRLD